MAVDFFPTKWVHFFTEKYEEIFLDTHLEWLTLVMPSPDIPSVANSVDPDQLASEEANWSGSALFAIKYENL